MGEKETDSAGAADREKPKTKSNQSNDRMSEGDLSADSDPEAAAAIKTKTKSNQSNDRITVNDGGDPGDDEHGQAAKLAPERPVKSEIAIGDPGVNGNLATNDPGVGAATPPKAT